jgi:LmbE family N-acetylglucosaminyl deacetylase
VPSFDVAYVSPHPDDAVFSAAGAIALAAREGRRVAVVTLFTRGEDEAESAARRAEDRAAVASLGAQPVDLGLDDAPLRDRALKSSRRLFAPLDGRAAPLIDELAARITDAA